MAAIPEEFLFIDPEPPSPSVFLDLPPTPGVDGDDPAAFDDMVLPYVSRLLMEEDIGENNFFYQYPDHPVLLQAQLPFAQILSDAITTSNCSSASPDSPDTDSTFAGGGVSSDSDHSGMARSGFVKPFFPANDRDMFTSAFLKGMEEANKFLPTNKLDHDFTMEEAQVDGMFGHGRGRKNKHGGIDDLDVKEHRASKLIMTEAADAAAHQMFDEMMLHEQDICMKGVQHLSISTESAKGSGKKARRRRQTSGSDDVVDLQTLLLHCAQVVATDDRRSAHELLRKIKQHASPSGDGVQRLAYCFAEGLEARLAGTGSQLYQSLMVRRTSVVDFLKAYKLFMAACCCKKVAFTFSNKTIHDVVAGKTRLHIVDYGLNYGFQWPGLLRGLAAREGGPPEVRITGIDLPQPGFRPAYQIEETGRRLSKCAREFGVPFRFRGIAAKRETIRPEDLHIDPAEVLVVSSLCHFRHLMDESAAPGQLSPRDQVLHNIQKMRPDVFIHGVMNGGYGTTYFPTRFRELLFFFSAQFDLLDATVPRDSEERMLVERDIYGQAALNVIACEGMDRVERPETYKQWQARNHRAGLRQLPLSPEVAKVVLDKVKNNYHKDFVVDEDQRWLLHRWKGRVLYALSTWVAADDASSGFTQQWIDFRPGSCRAG
ncbi:hypothetical protein EJB05_25624, partial [Eragrostis curvula]